MFKYAPGMESGLGAALNMMRKHAEPDGDEGTTVTNIFNMEDKESGMNDIAGNKACAEGLVGADNCQRIIGLHDRISAAQAASTQGFFQLDTKLCSSIAEVIASVRNQGDRTYDATRNVGDAVRDCCCKVEAQLATVLCEIRGVQRDIRESSGLINAKIELEALKAENARAAMECRLVQAQKDCCCEMNQRFDRLDCKLDNMQRDSEIARLTRENEALKNKAIADSTAASVVQSLQGFAISHYKPTQTATAPTA